MNLNTPRKMSDKLSLASEAFKEKKKSEKTRSMELAVRVQIQKNCLISVVQITRKNAQNYVLQTPNFYKPLQ